MKHKSIKGLVSSAKITTIAILCWVVAQILTALLWVAVVTLIPEAQKLSRVLFVILICAVSLVIGSATSFALTNRTSEITREINEGINKVAAGDYSVRLYPKTKDEELNVTLSNFNKMVKELASVTVLRKDFTTTFSHEFKTPIVSIRGYAELLREADNLTDEQKDYLSVIVDESKNLASLAERTMLLSKLDSGYSVEKKDFHLDEQLERCVLLFDSRLNEKNISFEFNSHPVKIHASEELLKEVWLNLLDNAVKYTPNGGKITLALTKKADDATISLSDTGVGMTQETMKKMYDSFYVLLSRDMVRNNEERLGLYSELFALLQGSRAKIRNAIDSCDGQVTDPLLLSDLMNMQNSLKNEVCALLDKLMQADINTAFDVKKDDLDLSERKAT